MAKPSELELLLTGQSASHTTVDPRFGYPLHRDILKPLHELAGLAADEGFDLRVVSGFRDYAHQLRIWNAKATGKRKLLDAQGNELEFAKLDEEAIVRAILRWSALPGASRHHWGTDLDIYDEAARPANYEVQLTPSEVENEGPFAPFHDWLDDRLESFDFFRPYAEDKGGVSPERWHLSYRPLSEKFLAEFKIEILERALQTTPIALQKTVLRLLPTLYQNFVLNISA